MNQKPNTDNIPLINFKPNALQHKVWNSIVNEPDIIQILFGGAAGTGKSYFGCMAIILYCLQHEGIRAMICRSTLTQLSLTTMKTFFQILDDFHFIKDIQYTHNKSSNCVTFFNGSEVYFRQIPFLPSDIDYNYLGSIELTIAFIDEVAQCTQRAVEILSSRLRYKVTPTCPAKLIMSCNPTRNFLYNNYIVPMKNGTVPKHIAIHLGTTVVNKANLPPSYFNILGTLNDLDKQRLLYGNWEYSDDINALFNAYDLDIAFTKANILKTINRGFNPKPVTLAIDVAGGGKDSTTIAFLYETYVIRIIKTKVKLAELPSIINNELISLRNTQYAPSGMDVVYDAIGVGYGLEEALKGKITAVTTNALPCIHTNIYYPNIYIFGFLKHQIKTAVHKNGLRFYLLSFYSHSIVAGGLDVIS